MSFADITSRQFKNQYHHINSDMTEMLKKVFNFCNIYSSYGALTV